MDHDFVVLYIHIICEHQKSRILKFFTYKFIPTCLNFSHTNSLPLVTHSITPWSTCMHTIEEKMACGPKKTENAKTFESLIISVQHHGLTHWAVLIESQNFVMPIISVQHHICPIEQSWLKAKTLKRPSPAFSALSDPIEQKLVAQFWLCADCNMYKSTVAYAKTH